MTLESSSSVTGEEVTIPQLRGCWEEEREAAWGGWLLSDTHSWAPAIGGAHEKDHRPEIAVD